MLRGSSREGCGDDNQHGLGHTVGPHDRDQGYGLKDYRICEFTNYRYNIYVLSGLYSCPWPNTVEWCHTQFTIKIVFLHDRWK